ncbi:hypothetical protein BTVI_76741 [Pitangus sulphuratus]|nr:hypothetical protein BTVI_76741 [Pitangus sulphuratus]
MVGDWEGTQADKYHDDKDKSLREQHLERELNRRNAKERKWEGWMRQCTELRARDGSWEEEITAGEAGMEASEPAYGCNCRKPMKNVGGRGSGEKLAFQHPKSTNPNDLLIQGHITEENRAVLLIANSSLLYERATQSGGELPAELVLHDPMNSSPMDVPDPLLQTPPVCVSMFPNLLSGHIIMGATCRKKQIHKEIHSEMEVVMFNQALCFGSRTAGALSGLRFFWSPGEVEMVVVVQALFVSTVDIRSWGCVDPGYCMQPLMQLPPNAAQRCFNAL